MKIQEQQPNTMPELRKLLRFNKHSYGVTIPEKYRKELQLEFTDYIEINLHENHELVIRKHGKIEK